MSEGASDEGELMAVVDFNENYGSMQYVDNFIFTSRIRFDYNWAAAKQVTGIYYIEAKDRFEVVDLSANQPISSRYSIQFLTHLSSYIVGFAPTIDWEETSNTNYYNPGGFFAHLGVTRNLVYLGIHAQHEGDRSQWQDIRKKTYGLDANYSYYN